MSCSVELNMKQVLLARGLLLYGPAQEVWNVSHMCRDSFNLSSEAGGLSCVPSFRLNPKFVYTKSESMHLHSLT